jgi:GT2 family glycosyltransferase
MRHTVIIPSYNTLEHLKNTYKSLKEYAPDADIIIIDDASEDGTTEWLFSIVNTDDRLTFIPTSVRRGHTYWYDEGMRRAKTDIVSILHSDMIIGPGYFENMLKHLKKGTVVCATRIEPPIHPAGKEKIVRDFGDEADNFKWDTFEKFVTKEAVDQKDVTTKGIFAPWMLYKEDHLAIGGHDQRFIPYGYEDSDIFNRWILAGYEMVQSRDALCYHMTCRGHRWNKGVGIENSDYKETMDRCRREYIRKWGDWIQNDEFQFPIINPKFNRGIILTNGNTDLLEALEPWADTMYTDVEYGEYIEKEQHRTVTSLWERIKPIEDVKENDIIIEVDGRTFNQQDYIFIQQLAAILKENKPQNGKFKLGNLIIEIVKYNEEVLN